MAIDMTSKPYCRVESHSINRPVIRAFRGLRTFQWGSPMPAIVLPWPAPTKIGNKPWRPVYYLTNLPNTHMVENPGQAGGRGIAVCRCCFGGQADGGPEFLRG